MAVWAIRNDFDCHTCTDQLKKIRGHDEEIPAYTVLGYKINKCPLLMGSPFDKFYIQAYSEYQRGILPNPGGSLNQPMKFFSIMAIIHNTMSKIDQEEKNV